MAVDLVPTSSLPAYSQTTALSGRDYTLDFDYVERTNTHVFSISAEDRVLSAGIALLPGRLLLQGLQDEARPPGDLVVVCDRDEPLLGDFGPDADEAAVLLYLTDEDLDSVTESLTGQQTIGAAVLVQG